MIPTAIGARAVAAAAALKPLGLTLLVSPPDQFIITDKPDDPSVPALRYSSIEQVEAFIADHRGTGAASPAEPHKPQICDAVHYVSYGTPGGEYSSVCRAAIVTGTSDLIGTHPTIPHDSDEQALSLCVLNPEGFFFNRGVIYRDGAGDPGKPDCPDAAHHGSPHRYCGCGWTEPSYIGGTWHWAGHE